MDRITKRKYTKLKRQQQNCRVYEVKINKSKLSQKSEQHLFQLFTEAKWFYNYCLAQDDINNSNTKAKSVPVKVQDQFEERKFSALKSGMKQAIKTRLYNNIQSLKSRKKNGYKVGRLKFKSQINSVPLKQFNNTFYLDFDNSKIKIQGMKSWIKANGLQQIPLDSDIANATLIKKADDFFLHITTFQEKESKSIPNASIGIDFGCESQLSFSDGTKIEYQVPVSKRIKKLDRKIKKNNRPDSKNKQKDKIKRQKAYQKLNNKKKDKKKKIVSAITNNFKYVCFQDENIKGWHSGNHGKKVQNSGIGGIISDLKHKSETPLLVNKFFPSTQLCPRCNEKNKHSVSQRTYVCDCGYSEDRDIHAASNIESEGVKQVPTGHREFTPTENLTSTFFDTLNNIEGIKVKQVGS